MRGWHLIARRLRQQPHRLALAAVLWLGVAVPAWANTIAVLMSGRGAAYNEVLDSLQAELKKSPGLRTAVAALDAQGREPSLSGLLAGDAQLLVTVGANAARAALNSPDVRVPILCVLLPRSTFESLQGAARPAPSGRRVSAIYLDQPLSRQVELIRQALPGSNRIGVVVGPESARDAERLQSLAEGRSLSLLAERASRDTELYPALQRALGSADVLLALPDPYIINAETAQNLLITSFRLRVPVIGFSAAYVRAGALAAVFSSPVQIGAEAGDMARQVARGQGLPAPKYPRHFSVAVNRQVARSLDLAVEDETVLRERLMRLERD